MRITRTFIIRAALALAAFGAGSASAQTAASLSPSPNLQFLDTATGIGLPCVNCTLSTFAAGTNTPLKTYTDFSATTQNPVIITLNSQGYSTSGIWIATSCYKFVLKNSAGSTIWSTDQICDNGQLARAALTAQVAIYAGATGSSLIGYKYTGTATTRTVQSRLRDEASAKDFGAVGDGLTDDTAAIRRALTAVCGTPSQLVFPIGNYIVAPTVTADYIFTFCSGIEIDGPGTIKIKNSGGSYQGIFGTSGAVSNVVFDGLNFNMNSANNAVPSIPDIMSYNRIAIHTGAGGGNVVIRNSHVTDVRSVWVFYVAAPNSSIINNLIDTVGGGAVDFDTSLIYVSGGAPGALVSGNTVKASARNANMAHTAIEVQDKSTVTNNNSIDMSNGINVVGATTATVSGDVIAGNSITGAYDCIFLWSSSGSGATGYGLTDAAVTGNSCQITQRSYLSLPGAMCGIVLEFGANLPFKNIKISANQVSFEPSSTGTDPINTASIGIGYWSTINTNTCENCDLSGNTVINAPAAAFRWAAGGSNISFANNTAINPGASPNVGLVGPYRSGFFLGNVPALTGTLNLNNFTVIDNWPTSRMIYGAYLASAAGPNTVTMQGVTVSCSDATCASMVRSIDSEVNDTALITATVNVPSAVAQPSPYVKNGSSVNSIQQGITYTWDGYVWGFTLPHPTSIPPVPSSCGTSPAVAGNDRVGRVAFGTGTVTTCTITFGTAFLSAPEGTVTLRAGGGAAAGNIRYTITSSALVIASGDGATNYASATFSWNLVGN